MAVRFLDEAPATPQRVQFLDEPPPQEERPGLLERFGVNVRDRYYNSLLGSAQTRELPKSETIFDVPPEEMAPGVITLADGPFGEMAREELAKQAALEEQARQEAIARRAAFNRRMESFPPPQGILENVVALAGQLTPTSPEDIFGPATAAGRRLVTRLLDAGAKNAVIEGAVDPIVQRNQIEAGLRQEYDRTQTILSMGGAFLLGSGIRGAGEALPRIAQRVGSWFRKAPEEVTIADVEAAAQESPEIAADPRVQEFLAATGAQPTNPAIAERFAERIAAADRRAGDPVETLRQAQQAVERSTLEGGAPVKIKSREARILEREIDRLREELRGILAGEIDPSFSTLPRQRSAAPDVIQLGQRTAPVVLEDGTIQSDVIVPDRSPDLDTEVGFERNAPAQYGRRLALPAPGRASRLPMTEEQVAQARASAAGGRAPDPQAGPDRLTATADGRSPMTRDQAVEQRQAGEAFQSAELQRRRAGDTVRDTQPGGRPPGRDNISVIVYGETPVQVLSTSVVRGKPMATIHPYDPRTGDLDPNAQPFTVSATKLREVQYAVNPRQAQDFVERARSPIISKGAARGKRADEALGLPEQTYRLGNQPPAQPEPAPRPQESTARPAARRPEPAPRPQELPAPEARPAAEPPAREAIAAQAPARDAGPREIVTPAGRRVQVEDVLVEADDLLTSDRPGYPQELQPRDRSRAASDAQIGEIAARFDPERVGSNRLASEGAPVISRDGVVESGNGRVMAIRRVYEAGGDRASAYRQFLEERGFDTSGFRKPVWVRRRVDDMSPQDRVAFAREANERTTAAMSATERARADAAAISDDALALYRGGDVELAANRDFVRAFMDSAVSPADRNTMIGPDGTLSVDGIRRIQNALLARAYDDADVLRVLTEATDNNIKSIGNALMDVSGSWAKMRAAAKSGEISADLDITKNLTDAAKLIREARNQGVPVVDLVNQWDAFSGAVDPRTEALLRMMFRDDRLTRPRGREPIADMLRFYADEAMKADATTGRLFGDEPVSADMILDAARRRLVERDNAGRSQGNLFGQRAEAPRQSGGEGGPEASGRGAGEAGPRAVETEAETSRPADAAVEGVGAARAENAPGKQAANDGDAVGQPYDSYLEAERAAKQRTAETGREHVVDRRTEIDEEGYTVQRNYVVEKPRGMSLDEASAHVAQANQERPFGRSWDDIEQMQGGKLRRDGGKQAVVPGAERDVRGANQRRADAPLRPNAEQKGVDDLSRFDPQPEKPRRSLNDGELGMGVSPAKMARAVGDTLRDLGVINDEAPAFLSDLIRSIAKGARNAWDVTRIAWTSNDAYLRGLAARYKSKTLEELADLFFAPPGTDRVVGESYQHAVDRHATRNVSELERLTRPWRDDPEALAALRDLIVNPHKNTGKSEIEKAARRINEMLDAEWEYRRAAGEDIGRVRKGYFPRIINLDKVAKAPGGVEGFKAALATLYRRAGHNDPKAAAEAYYNALLNEHMGLDQPSLIHSPDPWAIARSAEESRVFDKEADNILKDYLEDDVFSVLTAYFNGSAKRAEFVRRFGKKGAVGSKERAEWEKLHGDKTQMDVYRERIIEEVKASGVEGFDFGQVTDTLRSNLGTLGASQTKRGTRKFISFMHTWNILGTMDRATFTSMSELAMIGMRTGSMRLAMSGLRDSFNEFGRALVKAKPNEAREWAEALGVVNDAILEAMMQSRLSGLQDSKLHQRITSGFFKATLLHQFTEGTRVAALKMGRHYMWQLARDLDKGGAKARRATFYLRELGIAEPEAFAKWLKSRKGTPSLDEIMQGKGAAGDYAKALARFIDQTIMRPTRAERPRWANHPVGSLFYGLMSFSFSFKKNVIDRQWRLAKRAIKDRDPAFLASGAVGLPMMLGITYVVDTYVRPGIFGSGYDFENEDAASMVLRIADRAGFTGALSPIINAFLGVRYERDLTTSLSGPAIGRAAQAAEAIVKLFANNTESTDTAERNLLRQIYRVAVEPMMDALAIGAFSKAARTAAVMGTGGRNDEDWFVDTVGSMLGLESETKGANRGRVRDRDARRRRTREPRTR